MDAEILPEPTEEERAALLHVLAELDGSAGPPPAYRSPWRLAGLPDADEDDV